MPKYREVISDVRQDVKAANIDEWIPSSYIASKLKGFASVFIKREADDKRLFRYTDLWTTIKCLEMVEDDLINCCNISIPNCTTVMRSKHKFPELYTTRYGYLLTVTSVDYNRDYTPTTPKEYSYTKTREYQDRSKRYFWFENDYLIIPDSFVKFVTVKGMFPNKADALKLNCDANESDSCIRLLDEEFIAPPHLLQDIKNATTQSILQSYKSLQTDEYINLNDQEKLNPKL